ncbi:hypothetical protein [Nakamurella sp.]|uniref:hypothetical protein n=1 Tax=Nakamurella sp. TaxID=1869182 RepID=UPI003782F163
MTDSNRVPDASADARDRAGATEDYGGVPISESELARVWTTAEGDESGEQTAESAGPSEAGVTRPEVPADDPAPTEPS